MKLLITGGAGFIGSNFVEYWLQNNLNDHIVILDALTYAADKHFLERTSLKLAKDRIEFYQGDITDTALVDKIVSSCDKIVHFAAETHVDRSIADPSAFTRTNVLGTHILLEAARKHGIKHFHHVSTDEVFGSIPLDQNAKFNENTKYDPNSPYSASKAASDHLVNSYYRTYGLPITITNCSNNFGPYQHPEKFIPRSIIRSLSGQNIRIYTPGNQIRDWLYVRDHCRAIELVMKKGAVGETYCVGGMTNEVSNMDIAKTILSILSLPEDRMDLVTDRPGHDVKYALDWSKIQKLGWEPEHNISQWINATIDWYKHNKKWWQDQIETVENFYKERGEKIVT